jgi:hypothetical protein
MKKLKEALLEEAISALFDDQDVYILTRITAATTLAELAEADKFIILEDVEPQEAQNDATETPKKTMTAKKNIMDSIINFALTATWIAVGIIVVLYIVGIDLL